MLKYQRTFKILTAILSLLYFSFLIYAVFFARRRRHLQGPRFFSVIPFKNSINDYNHLYDVGIFNYLTNLIGNVLVFMPIAFIMAILFKVTRFSPVLLTGFLLSLSIELLQYIFDVGVADIDDIMLNTLGTALGFVCYKICKKWIPRFFNS
jgi:glycopeptide antibiotics resistance protein